MNETTTIKSVTRLNNSVNGNPNYSILTGEGEFITESDAMSTYKYNWDRFEGRTVNIEYYLKNNTYYLTDIKTIKKGI